MFGFDLDSWNLIMLLSLGFAALAAFAVVVSTAAVIKLQKVAEEETKQEFDRYKLGVSAQVAEAKKEGIEAGKSAGDALLRAAELEKEAANARLETERLKTVVAWRVISPEEASKLEQGLAAKPGSVNLRYTDGDPEALSLAIQISQILDKAKWQIAPGSFKPSNAIIFGIVLPVANGDDAQTLRDAFSEAKIPFSIEAFPMGGASFSVSTITGAPILMIGSKRPPLP